MEKVKYKDQKNTKKYTNSRKNSKNTLPILLSDYEKSLICIIYIKNSSFKDERKYYKLN